MANYQVLFNGEVADQANTDSVRDNLARELGLDERKAKQLFSGRTVVIRSHLDQQQAQDWQEKLNQLGAICRIKDLTPKEDKMVFGAGKRGGPAEQTLRDITAAHLECPRCGHMQLDSSHCARCGVDLEQAYKQQRKEDLLIEKKIRDLQAKRSDKPSQPAVVKPIAVPTPEPRVQDKPQDKLKKGMLRWFRK